MNQDLPIELDLSVETLALLGRNQPEGPVGTILTDDSTRPRCCGGGSENTPPTCCP
jgi:hypothetical protein